MKVRRHKIPPGMAVTFDGELVPVKPGAGTAARSAPAQSSAAPPLDRMETGQPASPPAGAPDLLPLPDVMQTTDYTCGPASLRSVLAYLCKRRVPEPQLAALMKTSADDGTDPYALRDAARTLGLWAEAEEHMAVEDLEDCLRNGVVVIVHYQAWKPPGRGVPYEDDWEDGHYSAVIGVDRDHVYLEDPWVLGRIESIPRDAFMQRWHGKRNDGTRVYQLGVKLADAPPDEDG